MPNDWTPERIANLREMIDFAVARMPAHDEVVARIDRGEFVSLIALARIGLSVVDPTDADVERVFSVLAWGQPERPVELANDDQMARAMAGNPDLLRRARAAIAAIANAPPASNEAGRNAGGEE